MRHANVSFTHTKGKWAGQRVTVGVVYDKALEEARRHRKLGMTDLCITEGNTWEASASTSARIAMRQSSRG